MDFEFDKEIDALLRQSAREGNSVFSPQAVNPKSEIRNPKFVHLDADEISAFAENALPEKARQRSMAHLADCDKCRKVLSNIIVLNGEAESEIVSHTEEKTLIAASIPWYRRLFAFPNLAFTMGALVLLLSGIVAYTVLQNVNSFEGAEVSQTYERQPGGKGMSSDGDATTTETYSSNAAMASNTMSLNTASMNSSSNSAANFSTMPSAPIAAANSNTATLQNEADKTLKPAPKSLSPISEPLDLAKTEELVTVAPPPPPAKEDNYQVENEAQRQQNQTQNSIALNQTQISPDSRNVQRAPSGTLRAEAKNKKLEDSSDRDDNAASEKSKASTRVGGKAFRRENNVWYDSTYRGQATTNVTRGTNEYKKLDAGLRGIAENLGGTVVVVWKEKAYRIQ